MAARNTGPADELAVVRQQIRELQAREKALRDVMLSDEDARCGADYEAVIVEGQQQYLDAGALRRAHPDIAKEFTRHRWVNVVKLRARDGGDGE